MKKNLHYFASIGMLAWLLQASPASAVAVNYNGAMFDVLVTGSTSTSYTFRYTADFTSAAWLAYRTGAGTLYIDSIGFGISGYDAYSITAGATNAPGTWTYGRGTINSSGCDLAAPGQGPCANVSPLTSASTNNTTYYWDITATFFKIGTCGVGNKPACGPQSIPDSAFLQDTNPIRGDFSTNGVMSLAGPFTDCRDGGCSSTSTSSSSGNQVPEPSSYCLLGLGLIWLALSRRARQRSI